MKHDKLETLDKIEFKMWMLFVFEVVLVLISGCFGILGNCLLIQMFMKSNTKLNFHRLMITLAIYDTIYIALCILVFAVPELFESYLEHGYHFHVVPMAIPLIQIALTGSVYCTVGISVERYLTVCHPFYIASKRWSAKKYIIPIIIFSFLYNVSRFFEMRTKLVAINHESHQNLTYHTNTNTTGDVDISNIDNQLSYENSSLQYIRSTNATNENVTETDRAYRYEIELSDMRQNPYYYSIYIIGLNFAFNGLIPFALIIILNTLLYKQLKVIVGDATNRKSSLAITSLQRGMSIHSVNQNHVENGFIQNREKRIQPNEIVLARISIFIVFVFIVCHSIRWIPNVYELIQRIESEDGNIEWPLWIESITQVSHFLTVLNSSVNFYIYRATRHGIPFSNCSKSQPDRIEMRRRATYHRTVNYDMKSVENILDEAAML